MSKRRLTHSLLRRLERLGYHVTLQPRCIAHHFHSSKSGGVDPHQSEDYLLTRAGRGKQWAARSEIKIVAADWMDKSG
jgi:hypothetical protein